MIRSTLPLAFVTLLVSILGCGTQPADTAKHQTNSTTSNHSSGSGLAVAPPISFKNLTVFPIVSKEPCSNDLYVTLDEGLASGRVEVFEGENGDANPFGSQVEVDESDPFGNQQAPQPEVVTNSNQANGDSGQNNDAQPAAADSQSLIELLEEFESTNNDDNDAAASILPPAEQTGESNPATSDGAQSVDTLYVRNDEEKPLYLMPGEIVLGGDQDRMIAEECIVPPGSSKFPIKVFCVEQGRWEKRDHTRTLSELLVTNQVDPDSIDPETGQVRDGAYVPNLSLIVSQTQDIQQGKFVGGAGAVTNSVRKAAQIDKSQQGVWTNVARENLQSNVDSKSSAFTANYTASDNVKRLEDYLKSLDKKVADTKNVVGVMVSINGKIESLDHFNSTPLFVKLWPKMLKGFALQAANASEDSAAVDTVTIEEAKQFFAQTQSASVAENDENDSLVTERRESKGLVCFSSRLKPLKEKANAREDSLAGQGGLGGGGFGGGGAIHSSAFPTK